MEELRELILAHLEDLHSTGLSNERYQLYIDTVYQCDTVESLIELAALELQLEAHEFFMQIQEQLGDLEPDDYPMSEELDYQNTEGFGDEDYDLESNGFGDEDTVISSGFGDEEDDLISNGFGDEDTEISNGFGDEEDDLISNGFEDFSTASGFEDDFVDSGEIDPDVLAIQRALLGGDDPTDPDYFDIDALLTKAGSVETEIDLGAPKAEYNDALANLLSAYPVEDEDQTIPQSFTDNLPAQRDGFGQPVSFGQPASQGRPSGFDVAQRPRQPVQPVQAHLPGQVQNQNKQQQRHQVNQQTQQNVPQAQQVQQVRQVQQQASVAMSNAKNVFAGFSKRKTTK